LPTSSPGIATTTGFEALMNRGIIPPDRLGVQESNCEPEPFPPLFGNARRSGSSRCIFQMPSRSNGPARHRRVYRFMVLEETPEIEREAGAPHRDAFVLTLEADGAVRDMKRSLSFAATWSRGRQRTSSGAAWRPSAPIDCRQIISGGARSHAKVVEKCHGLQPTHRFRDPMTTADRAS
jgi:hypothetical protein